MNALPSKEYIAKQIEKGAIGLTASPKRKAGTGTNVREWLLKQLRPGEMLQSDWCKQEAARRGVSGHAIEMQISRGTLPRPKFRKLHKTAYAVQP